KKGNLTSPWYREQCKELDDDPRKISQELDCNFLGSGDQVIAQEYLNRIMAEIAPAKRVKETNPDVWYWEDPIPDHVYMICSDVARGDGTDFSAFHVIDLSTFNQVAEYKGKLPTDVYAELLMEVGIEYNNALIICEINNQGHAVCMDMKKAEYANLFYSSTNHFKKVEAEIIRKDLLYNKHKLLPGFQTTPGTRPLVVQHLERAVRKNKGKIRSIRTLSEFKTFIWNGGRGEAMKGFNDDLTMAYGIGHLVADTVLQFYVDVTALGNAIINSMSISSTDNTDERLNNILVQKRILDPYHIRISEEESDDLRWLL
ncbi:MAG: hypothetical protein ACFFG0_19710, partial [Candidatus Thorarchaeota archaeon]